MLLSTGAIKLICGFAITSERLGNYVEDEGSESKVCGRGCRYRAIRKLEFSLRPVLFSSILPPAVVGLRSFIYRTLQGRLAVIFGFPVCQQKRGCNTQRLNLFLQP